jgi:hypothetical protein
MKWTTFLLPSIVIAGMLSSHSAFAIDCNPKAQVHQQRLANIQLAVQLNNYIPSMDERAFVLCMLPEKEDRDAFTQRVNALVTAQAQRQAQQEAQRKAAIEAHNRPQSPQEQAQAKWNCEHTISENDPAREAGMAYCLAASRANPHSNCAAGNLPCGTENERLCYNPYAGQRCVNGDVTGTAGGRPWADAFLSKRFPLPNGRYAVSGAYAT